MMEPEDNLDRMLFEYFDKTKDNIPLSTQNTINNALKSNRTSIKTIDILKKIAIVILSLIVATSGVVLAVNIIRNIKNNYIVSTNALDFAIENENSQHIEMDFVYDNNVGIKINNIYLDKTNLNIEYEYDLKDNKRLSNIFIKEYSIKDENDNIIYNNYTDNNMDYTNTISKDSYRNDIPTSEKNTESILYTSAKFPNISKLFFEIIKISVNNKDISGIWLFEVKLNNTQAQQESQKYITTYDKYIKTITTNLDKSSLKINMELNEKINSDILIKQDSILLIDEFGKRYKYTLMKDDSKSNKIYLQYDIGSYSNINLLNLHIKFDKDKLIDIKLRK